MTAALCMTAALAMGTFAFAAEGSLEEAVEALNHDTSITVTTAVLDEASPTGAFITFRFPAQRGVTRMAVGCDEMTFANENGVDIAPEDWVKGSWVHSNVRTSTAREMELVGDYWTATWPATNGSLLYYFYVGHATDSYIDVESTKDFCEAAIAANNQCWDPQNEPAIACWETQNTFAANQRRSLIYIPRPEGFTEEELPDFTIQDPDGTDQKGSVTFVQIPGKIDGENVAINCSVYLPYGYDPYRAETYPGLVLYHGASGDYTQWVAHGAANHILDNAIAEGLLEPTVVVIPDGEDSGYDVGYIANNILPYMEQNYHVGTEREKHAMAGLSMGGITTGNVLKQYPEKFLYFGGFSLLVMPDSDGFVYMDLSDPDLLDAKIYCAYGDNDYTGARAQASIDKIRTNPDIEISSEVLHGAHQMYVWRRALEIFVTQYLWK